MMKTMLPICLALTLCTSLAAQTWSTGARWFYSQDEFFPEPDDDYLRIQKIGDSVLQNGLSYSILLQRGFEVLNGTVYEIGSGRRFLLRPDGQQVYHHNSADGQDYLLYDFSKNAGDTLLIYAVDPFFGSGSPTQLQLKIDSVTTAMSTSGPLKVQWVSMLDWASHYMQGPIIEGIGWTIYLFPRYGAVDPGPGGWLLCFQDAQQTYPANATGHCGALVSTQAPLTAAPIAIFPNPTPGIVEVQTDELVQIDAYDRYFRRLANFSGPRIDLTAYPDGLYWLKIRTGHTSIWQPVLKAGRQ